MLLSLQHFPSKSIAKFAYSFANTFVQNDYPFFVDFKGMLHFEDTPNSRFPSAIKDVKFITQLYNNLRKNEGNSEYPYIGQFWGQRNRVRCAISPVVFSHIDSQQNIHFSLGKKCKFQPMKLSLDGQGRIWHPFKNGIDGVFSNELVSYFLDSFKSQNGKNYLKYSEKEYQIGNL